MMHIPLKTNIAADYITREAGRQDMEGGRADCAV